MATATKEQIIGIIMDEIKSFDYRDYYKCTQALSENMDYALSKIPKEFLTEQVEEFIVSINPPYLFEMQSTPSVECIVRALGSDEGMLEKFQELGLMNDDIAYALIKDNPEFIMYIDNPSDSLKLLAISNNDYLYKYEKLYRSFKTTTPEIDEAFVNKYPAGFKFVKCATESIKESAVMGNGELIKYIGDPSDRVKLLAIRNSPRAFQYIFRPSKEMLLEHIRRYKENAMGYISRFQLDRDKEDIIDAFPAVVSEEKFGEVTEKMYEQAVGCEITLVIRLYPNLRPEFTASIIAERESLFKKIFSCHMEKSKINFEILTEFLKINVKSLKWVDISLLKKFNKEQLFQITLMM